MSYDQNAIGSSFTLKSEQDLSGLSLSLSLSHRRTHCAKMADTKVETIARLAQWKIEIFGPATPYKRSDPFKIGIWNWYSSICLSNLTLL